MRYILQNIDFIYRDIIRRIPRVFFTSFGILFLISFLIIFISMRKSVKSYIENRILNNLNINEITITPKSQVDFINFNVQNESKNFISEKKMKNISSIKGIEHIQRIIRLNHPAKVRVSMFGKEYKSYMPVSGVERNFLKDKDPNWKHFAAGETVPVLLPRVALDMYNNFAAAKGMPELGEKGLIGLTFDLNIASAADKTKVYPYKAKVFGFTSMVSAAGILVPSEFIRDFCVKINSDTGVKKSCHAPVTLIARVKQVKELPSIVDRIKKMGLKVQSQKDIAEKTERIISFIDASFIFIMLVMLLLTVVAIFNSYLSIVYNRTYEISVQRVIGASKLRVIMTFLLEAGIVGFLYGSIGYLCGFLLVRYISENIGQWFALLKGLNLTIEFDSLFLIAILISIGISMLSALMPAVFASNLNLFHSTKKNK
jgi:ABC-type lipoprotein release transport system permease subunit